jgi:hypothetical protein
MDETRARPERRVGAIAFDLVLLGFALLLVANSLTLRPGVGTVPLLVGVPTLLGTLAILIRDLFPRRLAPVEAPAAGEPAQLGGVRDMLTAASAEVIDEVGTAEGPEERRRQLAFTAWTIGFVILAWLTSFYVAVPIALVGILAAIRLNWLAIVLIVVGTVAGFYLLFDLFLRVRL